MPYRINPITGEFDLVSVSSASIPLLFNSGTGVMSMLVANASQSGYLTLGDWSTFNAKQNPLLPLNTSANSGPATLTGGNQLNIPNYTLAGLGGISLTSLSASGGALTYNNTTGTFSMPAATSVNNGYLTFASFNTFSAKQNQIVLSTGGNNGSASLTSGNQLNIPTYTLAGLGGISLTALSAVSPMTYNSGTGEFNMPPASASTNGYLTSANWSTFNSKEPAITAGTTPLLQYFRGDKTFQTLNTTAVVEATNLYYTDARSRAAIGLTVSGTNGAATYSTLTGVLNIPTYTLAGLGGVPTTRTLTINGTAVDLSANRTWNVGTVTSVAALTIGTTGSDITSTVATGTTTPVITLSIPNASAGSRGVITSTDYTTFNNKQTALTLDVTGSGPATLSPAGLLKIPYAAPATYTFSTPLVNTAGTVSMSVASPTTSGYLTSTSFNTFNGKANTTSPLSQFAATTSAQLASIITDETGIGSLVFGTNPTLTSPTLITPSLGNATATTLIGRILPRVLSITSSASPSINTDLYDAVSITALSVNMILPGIAVTGTPGNFDKLIFRIKDDGSIRNLVWSSSFIAMGAVLPTATQGSGKVLTIGFIYDSILSKWGCVVTAQEA